VWWYEQLRPAFSLYHGAPDYPAGAGADGRPTCCVVMCTHCTLTGIKLAQCP